MDVRFFQELERGGGTFSSVDGLHLGPYRSPYRSPRPTIPRSSTLPAPSSASALSPHGDHPQPSTVADPGDRPRSPALGCRDVNGISNNQGRAREADTGEPKREESLGKPPTPERKYPDYCRTLQVKDSNGIVKELVFPKALDLDRPKRARTTFSAEQLYQLEREFQRNQYLVGRERTDLAHSLQLSETQVKVWFQNRRTKYKRDNSRQAEERKQQAEGIAACNILRMLQQTPPSQSTTSASPAAPPGPSPGQPPAPPAPPPPPRPTSLVPIPIAVSITNTSTPSIIGQAASHFRFPPAPPMAPPHVHLSHSFTPGFYSS